MALTHIAHQQIREHFVQQNIQPKMAVDMTVGNGHDTLFLCQLGCKVTGFDIQAKALEVTQERLARHHCSAELILDSHHNLASYFLPKSVPHKSVMQNTAPHEIDIITFNLGYLPHSDKQITTQTKTSLPALVAALNQLSPAGIISLLCYPGHEEGKQETLAIQDYLQQHTITHRRIETDNPSPISPVLFLITQSL